MRKEILINKDYIYIYICFDDQNIMFVLFWLFWNETLSFCKVHAFKIHFSFEEKNNVWKFC